MKQMTIWQRLNTALFVLVLLLMAACGLALWIVQSRTDADVRAQDLASKTEHVSLDLLLLSDSLRGLLLDPRSEAERRHRTDVEKNLDMTLKYIEDNFKQSDLLAAVQNIKNFTKTTLLPYQHRMIEMAESQTNAAAALAEYIAKNPSIRTNREALLADLAEKAGTAKNAELLGAQTKVLVLGGAIVIILFACIIVGLFQSSAVTVPLNRLVASLDRMRVGDFTDRLALERRDEFGVLSDGLNRLADDLSGLVGQVQRSGIQVNTAATEIAATSREQQSTANEIAATTAAIGATSKQISAPPKEPDKTMNEVSHVADETAQLANTGQAGITRMENTMRQIMEASSAITAKLAVLSEKTANINTVVTTIKI